MHDFRIYKITTVKQPLNVFKAIDKVRNSPKNRQL